MPDLDPRVGELLDRRTPRVTVEPHWDDVLRRAGAGRRSIVRLPRRRWLVLAAVLALPVGIAAAQAHHAFVRYLSGGVSGTPRQVIASVIRPFVGARHIEADMSRARQLVTVSVGGHRHAYYMAPLTHGNGGCYFEIVNRVHVAEYDCGYDPKGRYPRVVTDAVGTIFGAETLQVSRKPIWVLLGDLPAQRRVVSVRVRFQDGTSERAATNGPYFSYVVSGEHAQPGHRPTEIQGFTAGGNVGATQALDPSLYSLPATERRRRAFGRQITVRFLVASVESGLARQQIRAQDQVSTTPAKLVQVFGGKAASYPPHPVVFVIRGPLTIPIYLGGCASTPSVCPAPVGRWAYFAYLINPDAYYGGGPVPSGAIVWLRKAPIGAPYPDLSRLGHVRHDGAVLGLHGRGSAGRRKHQGRLVVILHRGSRTATTHTQCVYQDRYTPFDLCDGLARYIAFRRTPRTDETHSADRVWALIEGSLGGWHGCIVLTPADIRTLPGPIGPELRRGIWGGRHVWRPPGASPPATGCRR